jgi:hypothetical protein
MAVTIARAVDLAAVGANGGAWTTDMGVTAPGVPTDITTTPTAPWKPVGAISDKGIARAFSEKTQDIYAMGLVTPFLTLTTQSSAAFTLELYEGWRDIVKSVIYRKPVSEVAADGTGKFTFVETGTGVVDRRAWTVVVVNGTAMEWFYMPNASVALTKDQTFDGQSIAGVETEVTPYPDAVGNTIYHIGQLKAGVIAS